MSAEANPETPFEAIRTRPLEPERYRPAIGLIGCGGIAARHLAAYRQAGYRVTALSDLDRARAEARRAEFYPEARVVARHEELLADPDLEVVDIATHPEVRGPLVEAALRAGKHVLSQKPFVLDLDEGERLVALARERGVQLAVNQNARWAPHLRYLRNAVAAGLLGELTSVDVSLRFDHNWTAGTPFDRVHHLILYDFAIHWFDLVQALLERPAEGVYASVARSSRQRAAPPLLAHAAVRYPGCLVTLAFNGDAPLASSDRTQVVGTEALVVSEGLDLDRQRLTVTHAGGSFTPELAGDWLTNGFHGTMAALLRAIEQGREPEHSAARNLGSLALCFAALASADTGRIVRPGEVRRASSAT